MHYEVISSSINFYGQAWFTAYKENLIKRQEKEAQTLANLTGWDINYIRGKMELPVELSNAPKDPWWKRIWKD